MSPTTLTGSTLRGVSWRLAGLALVGLAVFAAVWFSQAGAQSGRPAPTGFELTGTHGSITLSWDDPDDPTILRYQMRFRVVNNPNGTWINIRGSNATTTSYTLRASPGLRYTVSVRAIYPGGPSPSTPWSSATASDPSPTVTLTTNWTGPGSLAPAGESTQDRGATVTVTATPAQGKYLTSWGGACEGNGVADLTCDVLMDEARTVSATFGDTQPTLTCESGAAAPEPTSTPGLVKDCFTLLAAMEALSNERAALLNWSANTAMTDWTGVTVSGTPPRVTALHLGLAIVNTGGRISPELGKLDALVTLSLTRSKLLGPIPPELGQLTNLRTLSLSRNQLRGSIPVELGQLTNLTYLSLSQNRLSGAIPPELGGLTNLEELYLYLNQFTGPIPSELGSLTNLEKLHLRGNQLTGAIPVELGTLGNLANLTLAQNALTGCVPRALYTVASHDLDELGLDACPAPSTTMAYDTYDTTGSVATAGSYVFKSDTGVVTTYEGLRDGTATNLLIHKTDAAGASHDSFYDTVQEGDLFEWKQADDCFVRYVVEEVMPDLAGTVPRKLLGVEWMTYAFTGCSGAIPATTSANVAWGSLPSLRDASVSAPVIHGIYQIVPQGWTGAVEPQAHKKPPEWTDPLNPVRTSDLAVARRLPYWRDPVLPAGWTFSRADDADQIYGYCSDWENERGYGGVEICGKHATARAWPATRRGPHVVYEARVIKGRPALVVYSPASLPQHSPSVSIKIWVYDGATESEYTVRGRDGSLRGSSVDVVTAIVRSLFESPNPQ